MIDEKRIDDIKARAEAATPGPWETKLNRHRETTGESWGWIDGPNSSWCWSDKRNRSRADAEFAAAAREDIPYLLDALAESQRREQAAINDLSGHCEHCAFRHDCAKHDNNDSPAGFTWWADCEDWQWRGLQEAGNHND